MTVTVGGASPGDDWYCSGGASLEQGDILFDFRVVAPVDDGTGYTFNAKTSNIVVLTQTCDIPKLAQRDLLVAEVHSYDLLVAGGATHLKKREIKEALSRGTAVAEFLLPPAPAGGLPWSLVSFRDVFVLPKSTVLRAAQAGQVLRLASPYKEYLAQAFARFVMRVGLPATLHEFETYSPTPN